MRSEGGALRGENEGGPELCVWWGKAAKKGRVPEQNTLPRRDCKIKEEGGGRGGAGDEAHRGWTGVGRQGGGGQSQVNIKTQLHLQRARSGAWRKGMGRELHACTRTIANGKPC